MSKNKSKYYEVGIRMLIRANSKRDAHTIAFDGSSEVGEILQQETTIERILASELINEN